MKLNLGCGSDVRSGYLNVDLESRPGVERVDLSKIPWPFEDGCAEELLMLDFLEHFPYSQTESILTECWRVLSPGGVLEVQVPDLEHCSNAVCWKIPFDCNQCGYQYREKFQLFDSECPQCGQVRFVTQVAAVHRLFGGQDRIGNWHYTGFTKDILRHYLEKNGFKSVSFLEKNERGETYWQNWNIKARAVRGEIW